jgi:putative ABC transport system permease protein
MRLALATPWSRLFMDTIWNDVRYALRTWTRAPGFTAVAILTIALGVGANTTMFSVINATLFRPLPFPEPDRLMSLWKGEVSDPTDINITSMPVYREWVERSRTFESIALFDSAGRGYNLTGQGEPEQVSGVRVTASFFTVLGVPPMLGRTFLPKEEEPGNDREVVLSEGLWRRSFGADPRLVGKAIAIDGNAYTVVGVMPAHFQFQFWSGPRELWVPAGWTRGDREPGSNSFVAIGRLKPGVSLEMARAEMDTIGRAQARQYVEEGSGRTVRVIPLTELGVQDLRVGLYTMLAVVGLVLLIACVNVANLLLARAATRQRELAIRCAVGAGRGRIVRQLLTESVLLALAGGIAGLMIAAWGTNLLLPILPGDLRFLPLRPLDRIDIDVTVLAFTFGASALSGILFGLAPAFATFRSDLNDPLKEGARGSTSGGRSRLRYALVSSEVALTLVTLAGAAMMIVSMARLLAVDPGLDPHNVLVMDMSLPQADLYYGPPDHAGFCAALDRQAGSVPGVLSVSGIAHLPLSGGNAGRGITIEGRPDPGRDNQPGANYTVACPNILRTLGVKLLRGREFTERDAVGAPGVVLVNESMARRFWPGQDAVGKRFKIGQFDNDVPWLTIVGVYKDVRQNGLDQEARSQFMRPYNQAGWPFLSIVAKTAAAPLTFAAPLKKALSMVEPNQPVSGARTMDDVVSSSVASRRFPMLLLTGFALLALTLAAVGIAGVVGYSVVQRTQEIGVRMALGAQPRDVLRLIVGHSLSWTLAGVGAGLIAALGMLRLLRAVLFDVSPTDPFVLGGVSLLLTAVALGASYLAARRATRVDPVTALRCG